MSVYDTKIEVGVNDSLKYLLTRTVEAVAAGMTVTYVAHSDAALEVAKAELVKMMQASQLLSLYDRIKFHPARPLGVALLHTNLLVIDGPSKIEPTLLAELIGIPACINGVGPLFVYAET
jgi:hypothetical protein